MNKKVIWSPKAKKDLKAIKTFYDTRNQSSTYSNHLLKKLRDTAILIYQYPDAATITDYEAIKGSVILDYILFYQTFDAHILILTVWDSRRNPKDLPDILRL